MFLWLYDNWYIFHGIHGNKVNEYQLVNVDIFARHDFSKSFFIKAKKYKTGIAWYWSEHVIYCHLFSFIFIVML